MTSPRFYHLWQILPQHLVKADSIRGFIHQHISDQLKQVLVILLVALLVILRKISSVKTQNIRLKVFTLIDLQFSRTYLPALVCSSHRRRPPWKYLVLVLLTILRFNIGLFSDQSCDYSIMRRDSFHVTISMQFFVMSLKLWLSPFLAGLWHQEWYLRLGDGAEDLLHHGEVLPIVVGLEQREPEVQLEGDAANTPDVAGLAPAQLQDHLGSPDTSDEVRQN